MTTTRVCPVPALARAVVRDYPSQFGAQLQVVGGVVSGCEDERDGVEVVHVPEAAVCRGNEHLDRDSAAVREGSAKLL